jgi:hypothetical protein
MGYGMDDKRCLVQNYGSRSCDSGRQLRMYLGPLLILEGQQGYVSSTSNSDGIAACRLLTGWFDDDADTFACRASSWSGGGNLDAPVGSNAHHVLARGLATFS